MNQKLEQFKKFNFGSDFDMFGPHLGLSPQPPKLFLLVLRLTSS